MKDDDVSSQGTERIKANRNRFCICFQHGDFAQFMFFSFQSSYSVFSFGTAIQYYNIVYKTPMLLG